MLDDQDPIEALRWQADMGADEAVGELPIDRFAAPEPPAAALRHGRVLPAPAPTAAPDDARPPQPQPDAVGSESPSPPSSAGAVVLADSLEALRREVEAFEGCPLKLTATNTVFGAGAAGARLMLVGEAPGAEEDRQGIPFVGASGRLLDRMLAAIGLDRSQVYISNILYWRPPGNRTPTPSEIAACLPFVQRQIELVGPQILVLVGGPSAKTLLGRSEGIMRLRGQWFSYATPRMARPIPARATFHPAFLLRSPGQKREAWRDLLAILEKMDAINSGLASPDSFN